MFFIYLRDKIAGCLAYSVRQSCLIDSVDAKSRDNPQKSSLSSHSVIQTYLTDSVAPLQINPISKRYDSQ